eukprot:maker-scaffold39_size501901-snap-gene-4.21 protein:Tk00992 transcript:maker-scaffold39_size501901-snap-gene-4.21-mRNA-1 annotation:"hypothetical protein DAPPUDRAFT_308003"
MERQSLPLICQSEEEKDSFRQCLSPHWQSQLIAKAIIRQMSLYRVGMKEPLNAPPDLVLPLEHAQADMECAAFSRMWWNVGRVMHLFDKTHNSTCSNLVYLHNLQMCSQYLPRTFGLSALGPQLGDCVNENFVVTAPANVAPPVICGFNTGQHMFLDASALCHTLTFNTLSGSTSNWEIKVTQFVCGAEAGGPDGCLQYYTGTVGTFASFNFPTNVANVPLTTTHLSNQCYSMCFKQEPGQCAICFAPVVMGIPGTVQGSFGLSNPNSVVVTGSTNQNCISDFLRIPGGEQKGPFAIGDFSQPQISKVCGRIFSAIGALTANTVSVCTQLTPFRLDFKTDANEVVDPAAATAQARLFSL